MAEEENLARQAEAALDRHGDYDSLFFEGTVAFRGSLAERGRSLRPGSGLGVRPGDRLVVLMANCPEVNITYIAAWRAGAVVTPLIFLVSEDELRTALVDSGAVAVVTTAEFLSKVTAAVADAPEVKFIICVDSPADADRHGNGAVSPQWHRRRRDRLPTGRPPTLPRCCTPVAPRGGPRACRSLMRTWPGAGGRSSRPTRRRLTPACSPFRWRTPTACCCSATGCTVPSGPGASSCAGSTRRPGCDWPRSTGCRKAPWCPPCSLCCSPSPWRSTTCPPCRQWARAARRCPPRYGASSSGGCRAAPSMRATAAPRRPRPSRRT